jgi:hypothetical protein
MSSNGSLAEFAARLRGIIEAYKSAPDQTPVEVPSFNELALQLFALQFEHNAAYRRFCEARKARPSEVDHWRDIPAVPTSAFKEWDISCLPAQERTAVFHSSCTTGQQPSRHFHHAASLSVYEASLWAWFKAHCAIANGQWQTAEGAGQGTRPSLAILTPPPAEAPHSSLVHMFEVIRREVRANESSFVGRLGEDGAWTLDPEAAVQLLRDASAAGQPVLVLGTAFSFVHLLDYLTEQGLRLALPPGSSALETGGYKGRSRVLPKGALHSLISQRLGIPLDRIICEYGMSELSSQAYDLSIGLARTTHHAPRRFCFPPWARVQIISPETRCEVGDAKTGLIRVFDLANVWSVMAIQTEDLGVRHGDGFALAGRAAAAEPRGCSLMAA